MLFNGQPLCCKGNMPYVTTGAYSYDDFQTNGSAITSANPPPSKELETSLLGALHREFRELMQILMAFLRKKPRGIHHNSHKRPERPNCDGFLWVLPRKCCHNFRCSEIPYAIHPEKKTPKEKMTCNPKVYMGYHLPRRIRDGPCCNFVVAAATTAAAPSRFLSTASSKTSMRLARCYRHTTLA